MKTRYFDVHVFYSRHNGYSVPVKATIVDDPNDDDIISEAVNRGQIRSSDIDNVDYVQEINEQQYKEMKS